MRYFDRRHHRARVLRDGLRASLIEGLWENEPLPSEDELAERFEAGRNVIREALRMLVDEGYLIRHQGVGTYPRQRVHIFPRDRLRTIHETAAGRTDISSEVLQWSRVPATSLYELALGVSPQEEVIRFERVTRSAEEPIVFWTNILRSDLGLAPPSPHTKTMAVGLFRFLEDQGLCVEHSTIRNSAVAADRAVAELLQVEIGRPLLVEHHTLWGLNERVIGISTGYFRADRLSFSTDLHR